MDPKEYSPMGQVVNSHVNYLGEELTLSQERLNNLQKLLKENQFADDSIQEMIYSERRVWSKLRECLVHIENLLKVPKND